jgi:hypothetical protein
VRLEARGNSQTAGKLWCHHQQVSNDHDDVARLASCRYSRSKQLKSCASAYGHDASKSDRKRPTRPSCTLHGVGNVRSSAKANSKTKGSCSQGNSRGLLEPYSPSALRGRCASVGHRLIPTFRPAGPRTSPSIPPGSGAPDGHSG